VFSPGSLLFFLVSDLQGAIEKTVKSIVGFLGFIFAFFSVFALGYFFSSPFIPSV
jgi:hypothetical protein